MTARSLRNRLNETSNIWPGFVDVLATLLIVIIFVLMVFTVSQIYLSDAISGRDKVLKDLKNQINELSKILVSESQEKQEALGLLFKSEEELGQTKEKLESELLFSEQLQTDISKKRSEIFVQEQNIIALSDQIKELLAELRIVANALETYEGVEVSLIETEGLGNRINKALATRIDQLKTLNNKLDLTNEKLLTSETSLANKVSELDLLNSKLLKNEKELESKILELDEKMNALFGDECYTFRRDLPEMEPIPGRKMNGVWTTPKGPRYTRLSGCWIFNNYSPWNIKTCKNTLFHNPWGNLPVSTSLNIFLNSSQTFLRNFKAKR